MKRSIIGAALVISLFLAPPAHADTASLPIGNPYTDTIQLWSEIASAFSSLANGLTALFDGHELAISYPTTHRAALSAAAANAEPAQPPTQQDITYTVQAGDTLSGIAKTFSLSLSSILAANDLSQGAILHPGENLTVPDRQIAPETSSELASNTISDQTILSQNVKPADSASIDQATAILTDAAPAFDAGDFVTQSELAQVLLALSPSPSTKFAPTTAPAVPLADGNPFVPYAAVSNIGQLSNVTITNANLSASEIPALNYFPATSTVDIAYGGTGTSTRPSANELMLSDALGNWEYVATSSLGIGGALSLSGTAGQLAYFSGTNSAVGTSSLFIASSGDIGIGTSSPAAALSVSGGGYFSNGLTVSGTNTINPTYSGLGALSAALTFNDPSPLIGSTTIGFAAGITTPELQVVTNNTGNTLGITNTNLAGIAAITFRGKDNSYTDNTTVFEHGSIFWLPDYGSGANQGLFGIEASRYDTANNPLIAPPDFQIQQTGGIDPTGGTTRTCSITNTSTSISCGTNLPANGSLITGVGTDIPTATTLVSGGGTTSGVMSNPATATNASDSLNFSNPTYAVRTIMNSVPGGNLNFLGWDGTNTLSVDRINDRVGILTTAPQTPLDVNGNARIGGTLSFAGSSFGIVSPGNVLHIGDADSASPVIQTIGFQNVAAGVSNTAAANAIIRGPLGTGTGIGGNLYFQTAPAGASGTQQGTPITRLSVLQTGQILVSSSTSSIAPENGAGVPLLQVQNAANNPRNSAIAVYAYGASSDAPANMYLEQSNSNTLGTQTAVANNTTLAQLTVGGSDGTNFQNSSRIVGGVDGTVSAGVVPGRLVFQTANSAGTLTEALRIDHLGNVAIGTTTPYARLTVWGPDAASSTLAFNVVNSASTTVFSVFDGGNAELSGSLSQSSDERLKTNITPLDTSSSLSLIDELNPVTFNWIDPNQTTALQLGFIAQQVQQIFPNLVSTTSATALTPGGTLSLNYIGLISPIVSAVQALSAEIASIENTIAGFAQSITSAVGNFGQVNAQNELCVGSTCVTPAQFQAIVAAASAAQSSGQGSGGAPADDAEATDTPPIIQVNGANPAIIQVGATYNDLGATITGPTADLNLGIQTFVNGVATSPVQLDTSSAATDTIDYVAIDQNGLTSTSTRTVIIEAPSIVPTDYASSTAATSTDATTTTQ